MAAFQLKDGERLYANLSIRVSQLIFYYEYVGNDLLLLRPDGMHTISKLLGLVIVRKLALHPNQIGKWRVSDGTVDGTLSTTLVPVVTFAGSGRIPVPVDIHASDSLCNCAGFSVALALGSAQVFGDELFLITRAALVDGIDDGVFEFLEAGLGEPGIFDGLELVASFAGLFGGDHQIVERLEAGVGGSEQIGVVAVVDGRSD